MAEGQSSSPEPLAEGHAARLPFPSDELLNLQDKMATLKASGHAPGHVLAALRAAWDIVGSNNITRQADMDLVRRFVRDDLQPCVDKLLFIGPNSRYNPNPDAVFEVLHLLVLVAASMLEYRATQSQEVLQELDTDLLPLMLTLLAAFNSNKPLHQRMELEPVPAEVLQQYDPAFFWQEDEEEEGPAWIEHMHDDEDEQMQDEDDMQQDPREPIKCWYTQLANTFGKLHGFSNIIKMLSDPAQVGFNLLNASVAVLAQVVYEATENARLEFCKVIEPVVTHAEYLVTENLDRLADYGSDRTFNIFDCLVNINMPRILEGALGKLGKEADQQLWNQKLRNVLRTFVTKMLDSSSFNKLLSGARECNKMLQHAARKQHKSPDGEHVLEDTCQWMSESNIVQRLLRTGLHHKQYMEQVRGVMAVLTDCGHLTAEHLDLMWAVTEKEDAYDAVKTHMFDLLAAVAGRCQPAQLDMLFAKLERRQSRTVQDTERLLSLLENLSESDSECKMVDKIINLIWDIIMPADAPPQLLESHSLIRVVENYSERVEDGKFVYSMVCRCFQAVHAGSGGQVPLLTNARRLFLIMPSEARFGNARQKGYGSTTRQMASAHLQSHHEVVVHLTKFVCSRAAAVRGKVAAAAAAAAGSASSPGEVPSAGELKEAAMAELAEGSWSLSDILRECLQTMQLLAIHSNNVFDDKLAEQLWDALMLDASSAEEWYEAALDFFRGGFTEQEGSYAYFDTSTSRRLLEQHLVKQDVVTICEPSVELTWDVFAQLNSSQEVGICALRQINLRSGKEIFVAVDLQQAVALDLIWRIYLSSQDTNVAELLWDKLLDMHCSVLLDPDTPWRKMLVESVVRYLREATDKLASAGPADDRQLHERMAARCLLLANHAMKRRSLGHTMPPVPAHRYAWRGTPVTLDLQREGSARMRLTTHDNEYTGLLRERVARVMGCSARHVRMFHMGQELQGDAVTVQVHELRNRSTLNAMESPEPNKFTRAPAEYRPLYELSSMSWLLSQEEGIYPLLLRLVDAPFSSPDMASMALQLLAVLPTQQALADSLAAALDGQDKQQQLADILDPTNEASMQVDAADKDCAPYQTLYALQALCALLFPTFDEVLLASADRDAAAEGSACPSPAAQAAAGANGTAAGAAETPVTAAEAAAVSAVQHQHQREVQQQEFLQSKGLEVVLAAAHKAAQCNSTDLRLRRQLSELLVVLLHNMLDAAHTWQSAPWAAAAVAAAQGNSNLLSAMSGAENGAGQAAVAAHAAPASSLVGAANGAAARSASILMPDAPLEADAVVSSGEAGESLTAAAPCSNAAAATTSDTACHHPSSPLLEVNSPVPGQQQQPQQQQQPSKQRQRDEDLPPLAPQQQLQQQLVAGASSNPAAMQGPSIDALFSSHTLKLMADTLLSVAVDTSQLWGSDAVAAAAAMHSEEVIFKDNAVARDAMQLLLRLLEQHAPLVQMLLLDVEKPPLVSSVLLSPYYGALRGHAAELFERLVSNDAYKPSLLPWLVTKLAAARPLAQQRPASCTEFFLLLSSMLAKMGHSWGTLPEQLFVTANAMLDEEVAALQAMAASGPPQGPLSPNSKLQQRRRRGRRQQQQEDPDEDAEGQLEPPSCCLLQGRLQLVLALVRVLDRRAVGSEGQGGLMRLLLQEFLFPEAVAKAAAAADQLNVQHCSASLEPHCATPNSRKAALELLAELMGDTPASLEEGVTMLLNLHYQHEVLERFSMLPKQLRSPGQYAGVKNGGATCYMNSVFQQLFMQPGIRARVLGSGEVPEPEKPDSVFAQLQGLFAQLALSKATFAQPYLFWAAFKDYDGTPIDVREHQDAYEFFTRLQDCVDQHLISTNQEPAIKPIMGGTFVQQIICRGHDFTSERNEEFYQISVEVKGMGTLQRSLEDYVKGELMEGDNAYLCEELGTRVPAVKRTAIKALPQMLCVHLKRFEFDYHNQTRHKLRDRFEFPLELDMFPYTAEGLAAADAQQSAAEQQQQQQQQSSGGAQQGPLRSSSGSGAAWQTNGPHPDYMYDLYGVVVHSGSAFTGHYYSYIKERPGSSSGDQGPRWYCFDDKDVTLWDPRQLETDCFGGKRSQDYDRTVKPTRGEYERAHSAYMLFYERRAASADANGNSAPAAGSAAQQQGGATAAEDVEMVPTAPSQPAAAGASAAEAPGAPAAAAGSDKPSSLQRAGSSFAVPYGMPESLFRMVTANNVNLIWQLHVLDKHYFRFVKQLVDSRGDLGQLATRKSRRREAAAAAGAAGAAAPLAAVPSGSSDWVPSSMVCDPSQSQQQQQPCPSTGSGALPMQVSPVPTPAPSAAQHTDAAAARRAAPPPLDVQAGMQQQPPLPSPGEVLQQSPGPSSRRGEEAEAVAAALMRLGTLFQFQVYLHAHDSLRSESNVWTEALKSLMGSGSSSSMCMQVFLELVQTHHNWLYKMLVQCDVVSQNSPRAWAGDMLSWVLQSASKRCALQLQTHVSTCLRHSITLGAELGQWSAAQVQGVEQQLRQQTMQPLGLAMLGLVDQLVALVRERLPRVSQQGQPVLGHEVPAEAVKVLLAFAESSPWAAAHLLQVVNIVPDLCEHIRVVISDPTADELSQEELGPLYSLLYVTVRYASNLPQLTREQNPNEQLVPSYNPHLFQLPGGSSPSSSGSSGANGSEAGAAGVHAALPMAACSKLLQTEVLLGLAQAPIQLGCKHASPLAQLLVWGNVNAFSRFVSAALQQLYNTCPFLKDGKLSQDEWNELAQRLCPALLQADQYIEQRVCFFALGHWQPIQQWKPTHPGLLSNLQHPTYTMPTPSALMALAQAVMVMLMQLQQHQQRCRHAHNILLLIGKLVAANKVLIEGALHTYIEHMGASQLSQLSSMQQALRYAHQLFVDSVRPGGQAQFAQQHQHSQLQQDEELSQGVQAEEEEEEQEEEGQAPAAAAEDDDAAEGDAQ